MTAAFRSRDLPGCAGKRAVRLLWSHEDRTQSAGVVDWDEVSRP